MTSTLGQRYHFASTHGALVDASGSSLRSSPFSIVQLILDLLGLTDIRDRDIGYRQGRYEQDPILLQTDTAKLLSGWLQLSFAVGTLESLKI